MLLRKKLTYFFFLAFAVSSFTQNRKIIDSLKIELLRTTDATAQFNNHYALVEKYRTLHLDSAHFFLKKTFEIAQNSQNRQFEARTYLLESSLLRDAASYDASLQSSQKALSLFESLKDNVGTGKTLSGLGLTYKRMGDAQKVTALTQKALEYAEKAVKTLEPLNDTLGLLSAYNNLGIIYRDLKMWEKTEQAYQKGLSLAQRCGIENATVATLNSNFGQLLMDYHKDYPAAIAQLNKAMLTHEKFENKQGIESTYRNMSVCYQKLNNFPQAVICAEKSVEKALEINDGHRLFNAYQILGKAQEGAGLYKEALESFINFKWYEDSIMRVDKTRTIAEMENKYQSAKKEVEIGRLNDKNRAQQHQLIGVGVALAVLLGLLTVLFFQNKKIKKNQIQIAEQSEQLKLMMRELHHRVKNNLAIVSSLLKIQSNKLEDAQAVQAVRQGQQRVEAMALIHQRLYQTDKISEINIKEYITDLVESLMNAYGFAPDNFDLHLNIEQERLDVDTAMPLGLIINELLTNSFKYAYENIEKPSLTIALKTGDGLQLEVRDNGKGIDLERWKKGKDSFGKKLVAGLSKQIGGDFSVSNDNGACFKLHISAEKWKKAA